MLKAISWPTESSPSITRRAPSHTLDGGAGNDTYLFARGDDADVASDNDTAACNSDLAQFAAGIANDQLWFPHVGNNLVQAMAAFAPPSAGQTTLPPAYQTALAPVLAANWQ